MVPSRPRVSIVIPHLNQIDSAKHCLLSLRAQSYPADRLEVILADNGSSVSLRELSSAFPEMRLVQEARPGPGLARNAGVAAATGEILAFIDADCRAHPLWVEAAVAALCQPEATGIVGGDVQIALANPAHMTGLEAYESVFAYRQAMYIHKLGFSGAGNLAMRRAMFEAVGPFAGIGIAEDRDWGRRAQARGYRTLYAPDMIVYHPARTDMADMAAKWRRQTAHDLADHHKTGRSDLVWLARMAALMGITPVHALRILASPRVHGLASRLRGVACLAQIRHLRVREMWHQWADPAHEGATGWNRGA